MGQYSGGRTQHALKRAKEAFADRDFENALSNELEKTRQFLSDHKRPPNFSFLAHFCETTSFRHTTHVRDIVSIDFTRWRLALELRLLQWRVDLIAPMARPQKSRVKASNHLNLAICLCLTDRHAVALPIFHKLAKDIGPVLSDMSSRKDKTRDWGAIGFVFQSVLETKEVPKALARERRLTLEEAKIARATYCDGRDPYGSLLSSFGIDLIPVELIFLSRALGHSDQEMAELDKRIQATNYPEDKTFQEIDIELSIAGI